MSITYDISPYADPVSIPEPLPGREAALSPDAAPRAAEPRDTEPQDLEQVDVEPLGVDWFASGTPKQPATDAERRALASVLRLRILRMCLYEPLTNREIAQRVGLNPATVLHHVRILADQGFLAAQQARRGRRGSREIPYRSTGKSWRLEMGDTDLPPLVETFIAEVEQVPVGEIDATRLGLRLSPGHEEELRSRLAAVIEEFASRAQDPVGKRLSLFLAIHPEP